MSLAVNVLDRTVLKAYTFWLKSPKFSHIYIWYTPVCSSSMHRVLALVWLGTSAHKCVYKYQRAQCECGFRTSCFVLHKAVWPEYFELCHFVFMTLITLCLNVRQSIEEIKLSSSSSSFCCFNSAVVDVSVDCCCHWRCNVVIRLLENATKISLTDETCDDCQSAILDVQFKVIINEASANETKVSVALVCRPRHNVTVLARQRLLFTISITCIKST